MLTPPLMFDQFYYMNSKRDGMVICIRRQKKAVLKNKLIIIDSVPAC
jgi:hypothetical protein